MVKNRIPNTRKSVDLPQSVWDEVEAYRQEHQILTITEVISRLVKAGLASKPLPLGKRLHLNGRRTITLPDSVWAEVATYRTEHGFHHMRYAVCDLVRAGLTVKIAIVGKNAKREAL